MVKKLEVVQAICKKVGITRTQPKLPVLSKKEMLILYSKLNLLTAKEK